MQTAEQEILRFIDTYGDDQILSEIASLDELNSLLKACGSALTGALIPLEQAQRPPKILVDSGITSSGIAGEPFSALEVHLFCSLSAARSILLCGFRSVDRWHQLKLIVLCRQSLTIMDSRPASVS